MYFQDEADASTTLSMEPELTLDPASVRSDLLVFGGPASPEDPEGEPPLHAAIQRRNRVRVDYQDAGGEVTRRIVRPLGFLPEAGPARLVAWCEIREDFRVFRLDRILDLEVLDDVFPEEPGRTFIDYLGVV